MGNLNSCNHLEPIYRVCYQMFFGGIQQSLTPLLSFMHNVHCLFTCMMPRWSPDFGLESFPLSGSSSVLVDLCEPNYCAWWPCFSSGIEKLSASWNWARCPLLWREAPPLARGNLRWALATTPFQTSKQRFSRGDNCNNQTRELLGSYHLFEGVMPRVLQTCL